MATPQGPQNQQAGGNRPGAMTMAMKAVDIEAPTGPKVLRIGVIQNGKIIEERIIRNRESVSVGTSEKNHFIVHAEGLASSFEVFQLVGNDYILNFTEDMTGRVGLSGGVQELTQLRTSGGARKAAGYWQVKLNDASRGKVVIGNSTLLFQFVAPPPVTPKAQLPAAARGGFVKQIDWLFTSFVVASFMFFFGFIIWLEQADWPISQDVTQLPDGITRLIFDEPAPPPEPVDDTGDEDPVDETTDDPEPTPQRAQRPSQSSSSGESNSNNSDSSGGESRAEATQRLRDEARAQAEAVMMTALGGDGGGAFADVMQGGLATSSASDVLEAANGVGVATMGSAGIRQRGGSTMGASGMGIGGLDQSSDGGMAAMEGGMVTERRVGRVRASGGGSVGGSGDFDSRLVTRRIRGRISAIKRCYERELTRNPTLRGTVRVSFTITQSGSVTGASADGMGSVGSCVVGVIRRLRFSPGPTGGSVRFRYPFTFEPGG